jgi:O-antigen ligase
MILEILILILLFIFSFLLVRRDLKLSLFVLLILSVLLHKQLFSIYQWDFLPVRIFMAAFLLLFAVRFLAWLRKGGTLKQTIGFLQEPFVLVLVLLWAVRGVSIIFTQNFIASMFLFAFFTTMVVLGLVLYKHFYQKPQEILTYVKTYIFIMFALSLVALLQFVLYLRYEIIFGALWDIPGHWPRVGSLFWDVNHFGALLAGLLPVAGALVLASDRLKHRVLYLLMLIPMTGALFFTNSRTSWLSAGVALGIFLALLFVRQFKTKGVLLFLLGTVLVLIPVIYEYNNPESPFRARVRQHFNYRVDSFDAHLLLIKGSVQIFDSLPVLGGGYGGFFEHFGDTEISTVYFYRDPAAFTTRVPAHTVWGEVLAETGAVGMFVFISFLLAGLLPLIYLSLKHKDLKKSLLTAAMTGAVVGWLAAGIFYSYNSEFFWIVLFLYFIYGWGTLGKDNIEKVFRYFLQSERLAVTVLTLIAGFLLFVSLGTNHLLPWDEAIYAKISKNMISTGEYVVQEWRPGQVWYEKPPLYMWLAAVSMKIVGVSEFAARLPSALLALATVVLLYFFGKRMFNKTAGFISAFVLVTTFHYLYYARASMLDVAVTFFITLSLYLWWVYKEKGNVWLPILAGVAVGLGVMTKGVVGFIPLPVIFLYEVYLYLRKEQKLTRRIFSHYLVFGLASAAVFMPWHWEMYVRFGQSFVDNYIGYHVLERATAEIEEKGGNPLWWYIIVMKVSMRIWFVVLIPAFVFTLIRSAQKVNQHVFLLVWVLFTFVLFSVSQSKLIWYIIPIYPAAALMVGYFIDYLIRILIPWAKKLLPVSKTDLLKYLSIYILVFFGLSYLLVNRELVYTSDLTGSRAEILKQKDLVFGVGSKVYVDSIEDPLVLYYTDGPFEMTTIKGLEDKFAAAGPNTDMVFITKRSRFISLQNQYPQRVKEIYVRKEWVLGLLGKELPPEPLELPLTEHTPDPLVSTAE